MSFARSSLRSAKQVIKTADRRALSQVAAKRVTPALSAAVRAAAPSKVAMVSGSSNGIGGRVR